jgi:phenylpropionate dioxygenase-like ring-hydroxylating dioxygenase large terminal subunit
MTETNTGTNRSAGLSYQQLLDEDSHPVRDILRIESPMPPGPTRVPVERYYSREFHDLEVEKIWKRVWQMACHEDDIPDVGDYHVYEVAHLSFLIVRSAEGEIKAFHNACLHRGRLLRETHGKWARELRCPFHGWSWNLDGSLREIPCKWDFPTVDPCETNLPEAKVGRWGGFVFINPDPNAEPLEDFLGNLSAEFSLLPYEKRYKSAHVAKVLRCNWKVAQEAFSEAYHVIATHPVILDAIGDANTKYDVFGNYSRAFSPNATPSPHLATQAKKWDEVEGQTLYTRRQHPLSGAIYERVEDGVVRVTTPDGRSGLFDDGGVRLEGDLGQVDPHMCNWIGGRQLDGAERIPLVKTEIGEAKNQRAAEAAPIREALRETLGDLMDEVSDAELIDSIYYTVFPNFHPWGSFHRIVYRFRPYGDDPDMCIHECMYFSPAPDPEKRPPPAPMRLLGPDDDWTEAPELGLLAKVFNQDILNLPKVQAGLKATRQPTVIFGDYGESKIRHFHELLEKWIAKP